MMGQVFLVGAGPGDGGLMTLLGKALLDRADVVVYDALVGDEVLAMIPPAARCINVGKRASRHTRSQEEIDRILLEEALAGHTVVRLKGGDPFLFGRGGEELELLAEHFATFGEGWTLIRREYPTAIGPVDLLGRDSDGATVAVEVKRRGNIDGVEQLTRYLEMLNRDEMLSPVTGIFAAQEIKPQARTLAEDRGIRCVVVDYDALRGTESNELRLF